MFIGYIVLNLFCLVRVFSLVVVVKGLLYFGVEYIGWLGVNLDVRYEDLFILFIMEGY